MWSLFLLKIERLMIFLVKFKTGSLRFMLVRISSLMLSLCKECFPFGNFLLFTKWPSLLNETFFPLFHKMYAFHCKFCKIFLGCYASENVIQFMSSAYSDLKYSLLCHILTATLVTCTVHFVQCKHKPMPSNKHKGSYQMSWTFQQFILLISYS